MKAKPMVINALIASLMNRSTLPDKDQRTVRTNQLPVSSPKHKPGKIEARQVRDAEIKAWREANEKLAKAANEQPE